MIASIRRLYYFLLIPIWLRVLLVGLILVLIPTVVAFVLIEREVQSVDRANLLAYMEEEGERQRAQVVDAFNRAQSDLQAYLENDDERFRVLLLLVDETERPFTRNAVEDYLNSQLVGSGLFNSVRVVDSSGVIRVASERSILGQSVREFETGASEAGSATFIAFQNAVDLDVPQRWVITNQADGTVTFELVQVIGEADNNARGYFVADFNHEALLYNTLTQENAFVDTLNYMVTLEGEVIADDDDLEAAQRSAQANPVVGTLTRQTGTVEYSLDDRTHVSYYAPLFNLNQPLTLVVDTPLQITFVQTLDRIYDQGLIIVLLLLFLGGAASYLLAQSVTQPLRALQMDIAALGDGDFDRTILGTTRRDEIGSVSRTFGSIRDQIRTLVEEQSESITARVRDLQATQTVTRTAAIQRDSQTLMNRVVDQIIELFPNIYHAQIFLLDPERRFALLRASTGEVGQTLLSRGHRLGVGSVSVIGQVTEEGRVVVARDTSDSEVHRLNKFLPETRAELAIPLSIGDTLIGALDVQSKQSDSFTADQINILQTMADQIAIAIENTRLYQESIRRLDELNATRREDVSRDWRDYLYAQRTPALVSESGVGDVVPPPTLRQQAIKTGQPAVSDVTERDTIAFAIPVSLRDQVLGAVEWEIPAKEYSGEKLQLASELVNRLAISLDNARLFQESRRATDRERLVNDIAARLTGQTDIDEILQTAVREVGQALRVPKVAINLHLNTDRDDKIDLLAPTVEGDTPNS